MQRDRETKSGNWTAPLLHRDRINEFIRPLNLYRAKSLEDAFRNPTTRIHEGEVSESTFVSSEQAFQDVFQKTCWPDPCPRLDIVLTL